MSNYKNLCNKCKKETYKYSCLLDYNINVNDCISKTPGDSLPTDDECRTHFEKINPSISEIGKNVGLCIKCKSL